MNQGKLGSGQKRDGKSEHCCLRISELKWTGMSEIIQMTIISTTVGKNPLEEME